jgi:hypothetical protein
MKRKIFLLAILLNYQYLIIATSDSCSTYFEAQLRADCESLEPNDSSNQQCSFSNNKCQQVYKVSCTQYTVKSGETVNNNICSLLPTSNLKKKCQAKTNSDGCEEVDRKCEEYKGEEDISCEDLKAEDGQYCVLSNNKCSAHYKKCDSITNNDNNKCNNNLPLPTEYTDNKYSKCEWTTTCEAVDRTCSEYKTFKDFLTNYGVNCKDLKPSDTSDINNKCVLDNGECKEEKADCEDYKQDDENVCNTYKPIEPNTNKVLSNYQCGIKNSKCTKIQKKCSDYKKGIVNCDDLISSKDETGEKIKCSLENEQCVEKYVSCGAYNDVVEDKTKRSENECKEIQPSVVEDLKTLTTNPIHIKCSFDKDSKECKEEKKECTDMEDKTSCTAHSSLLDNSYKVCYFKNNKCIEQFATCEDYQNYEVKDKQDSKGCLAIREDSPNEKCVFTDKTANSNAKCVTETKKCSEFSIDKFKNICTSMNQCVYNNGACTTLIEKEKEKEKECPKCECPSKEEDGNNSGNEKYLNKILIFITCLLL